MTSGSGSGGSGATTTTTSAPPANVSKNYDALVSAATDLATQPLTQYTGSLVAGFTPQQQQGFTDINNANGVADPYINSAAKYYGAATKDLWGGLPTYSADTIAQYESPYTKDVTKKTEDLFAKENAQQQAAVQGNATTRGAYGGDREAVAQALQTQAEDLTQAPVIADIQNKGYLNAQQEFNDQQKTQLSANQANAWLNEQAGFGTAALGKEAQDTALTGAKAELEAGGLQQKLAQTELNIPYEQYLQQQAYPYKQLNFLTPIVEGTGSLTGGTGTTTTPGPSTLSTLTGLGLAGTGVLGATGAFGSDGWLTGSGTADTGAMDSGDGKRGGRVAAASGGTMTGLPGIGDDVPVIDLSYIPGDGFTAANPTSSMSPFKPVTTTTGSGGGGGSALSDLGSAAGVVSTGLKIAGLFGIKDGGHVHRDDGGMVGIGDTPRSRGTLDLPERPVINLDYIVHPGPEIKGSGPPKAPAAAPQENPIKDTIGMLGQSKSLKGLFGGSGSSSSDTAADGGRIGLATGGGASGIPLGAAIAYGGEPPNVQKSYQELLQLPINQLQEMAVQFPSNTQQGQLVARALAAKKMSIAPAQTATPATGGTTAAPGTPGQSAIGGGSSLGTASLPTSAQDYGGTAHLASGGVGNDQEGRKPKWDAYHEPGFLWSYADGPHEGIKNTDQVLKPHGFTREGEVSSAVYDKDKPGALAPIPHSPWTHPTWGGDYQGWQSQSDNPIISDAPSTSSWNKGYGADVISAPASPGYAAGGAADDQRGYVTEDEIDPHPVVDHSGDTVKIRYRSEGKTLDLGLPSIRDRGHFAAGGSTLSTPASEMTSFKGGAGIDIPLLNSKTTTLGEGMDAGGGLGEWFRPMDQLFQAKTTGGFISPGENQVFVPKMGGIIAALKPNTTIPEWAGGPAATTSTTTGTSTTSGTDAATIPYAGPPGFTGTYTGPPVPYAGPPGSTASSGITVDILPAAGVDTIGNTSGDSGGGEKRGGRIGFDEGGDVDYATVGTGAELEPVEKKYPIGPSGETSAMALPSIGFGKPPGNYVEPPPAKKISLGDVPEAVDPVTAGGDWLRKRIDEDRVQPTTIPRQSRETPFTPRPGGIGSPGRAEGAPAGGIGGAGMTASTEGFIEPPAGPPPIIPAAQPVAAQPAAVREAEPAPPPAPQAPAPPSPKPETATGTGTRFAFFGDSVAHGTRDAMNAPGVTKIGWHPDQVLGAFTGADLRDAPTIAVISSGITNSTDKNLPRDQWQKDISLVPQQIDAARGAGAKGVILYGVGEGVRDNRNINERLSEIAASKGATFVPLVGTGAYTDKNGVQHAAGWHPNDYGAQGKVTEDAAGPAAAPARTPSAEPAAGHAPPQVTRAPGGTNGIVPSGAPAGAPQTTPLPPVMNTVADTLMNSPEGKALGLTKANAAGILGHTVVESPGRGDINPTALNPRDTSGLPSKAIFQWQPDRWTNGLKWAQQNGITDFATNPTAQARFGLYEVLSGTDGSNGRTLAALKAAGDDPVKSSIAWAHFERGQGYQPDHPDYMIRQDERNVYADQINTALNGGQPFKMDVAPGRGGSSPSGGPPDQVVGPTKPGLEGIQGAAQVPVDPASQVRGIANTVMARTPPEHRSGMAQFMNSPWFPVFLAGAGMLASRSPFPGVALGEGLLTAGKGMETVAGLQNKQDIAELRTQHAGDLSDVRSRAVDERAQHNRALEAASASRATDLATHNAEMTKFRYDQLLQTSGDKQAIAAARDAAVQAEHERKVQADKDKDERERQRINQQNWRTVTGDNGNLYKQDPTNPTNMIDTGVKAQPKLTGERAIVHDLMEADPSLDMAGAMRLHAEMKRDPRTAQNSQQFAHLVQQEAARIQNSMQGMNLSPAQAEMQARRNVQANLQLGGAPAAAPAAAPAQPAAAAAKPAEVIQNGWRYDATTHQPIGPAQ